MPDPAFVLFDDIEKLGARRRSADPFQDFIDDSFQIEIVRVDLDRVGSGDERRDGAFRIVFVPLLNIFQDRFVSRVDPVGDIFRLPPARADFG